MNSKRRLICWGALAIFVALLGTANVMASGAAAPLQQNGAPALLNYQGLLLDPTTGEPVPDGNYTLTFAIYDDATSTDPSHRLWEETQTVSTQNGLFNVILGATNPIDTTWLDGRDLWLGITVQGESEMTPRTQLVSMPYALNANDVRGADIHPDNVHASNSVNVDSASVCGVGVSSASVCGVYVGLTNYGVYVDSAGDDGVYVDSAGDDGVDVGSAGGDGVYVDSAGDDGVHVSSAGNPSTTSFSTDHNGFEVAGAEGSGLYVGQADDDGVHVDAASSDGVSVGSAGFNGMHVYSAGWNGVNVYSAGANGVSVGSAGYDGVSVGTAGNPSTTSSSTLHNGFEVAGAQGHGLYVGRADYDGVHVGSAGDDGVYVHSAGSPSATTYDNYHNGFEVAGAERDGLYVGHADDDGVHVGSAGDDGVYVTGVGGNGVTVWTAADDGVFVLSAGRLAGNFYGDVQVTGHFSKGGGSFKIDHPLDPQNQYLYHSFVESPDMMNVYNGNVTLDAQGEAWVELPAWFETLNQDYRYQLTPIGAPGPNLYVAQEVKDNRFQIAGGTPGMKVSWQVTGIRHDPYAEANRIAVEEDKPPEERGTYLHPQAYGQPETMGLAYKEAQARENRAPPPER